MLQERVLPRPAVAAVIVNSLKHPTEILCTARAYPQSLRGLYEFPGGKVEAGEDPRQALKRELVEELSVRVSLGAEVLPLGDEEALGQDGYPAWQILEGRTMRVWLGQLLPHQVAVPGDSHLDAIWVPLQNVEDLPWLPTNRPILDRILTDLRE